MKIIISNTDYTAIKTISDEYTGTEYEWSNEVFSWDDNVTCIHTTHNFSWIIEWDGTKLYDTVYNTNIEWEILTIKWEKQIDSKTEITFTLI